MMAIWVIPLPCGPPMSGVRPTSVKVWRSVSRFDPQIDTWSISSTTLLLPAVIADRAIAVWEMSKRTRIAKDKRQQIGIRASLSRRKRNGTPECAIRERFPASAKQLDEWYIIILASIYTKDMPLFIKNRAT